MGIVSMSAGDALKRLAEGNQRFVAETRDFGMCSGRRRCELVAGQNPFAVILGCSDSRVPAEIIFDQGLGDLFVIRIAGNIVARSQVGSIELALEAFRIPLVIVLGHSHCGAVLETLAALQSTQRKCSSHLNSIVSAIRPAVETLLEAPQIPDAESLLKLAIRANIRASVRQLQNGSASIEREIAEDRLRIIGAEYALETGVVEFLAD